MPKDSSNQTFLPTPQPSLEGSGSDRSSPQQGDVGSGDWERGQSHLPQQVADREITVLAQQLRNPSSAGSYTLQCSVDELRNAVQEAGFALFDADLKGVKGKQNLLGTLAHAANFPPEFGANWDALADALCDLSWCDTKGYVLLLRNASDTFGLSANDREIAQDIFTDTVVYWRQRNKPFWIFFS